MARISTYPNDTNVIGADKWIGSDANNNNQTKNFTADAVAAYFNRASVIDTGNFSWNFVPYSTTIVQSDKTFSLVGYTNTSIGINQLEGILKVSFLTLANSTPGTFIQEQWLNKIILANIPNSQELTEHQDRQELLARQEQLVLVDIQEILIVELQQLLLH
jgi:hypothetical protein